MANTYKVGDILLIRLPGVTRLERRYAKVVEDYPSGGPSGGSSNEVRIRLARAAILRATYGQWARDPIGISPDLVVKVVQSIYEA